MSSLIKLKSYGISSCLFAVIKHFLNNCGQCVVLNGKSSIWSPITAGVFQGPVLGPLLFLIHTNDLAVNISSDTKLFADDTSLFTVVYDTDIAANQLNRDLEISGRCNSIPTRTNRPFKFSFPRKKEAVAHPPVFFSGSEVVVKAEHKHLGMILDSNFSFQSHVREAIIKARKGIGIIHFLSKYVPWVVLYQIDKYTSFM